MPAPRNPAISTTLHRVFCMPISFLEESTDIRRSPIGSTELLAQVARETSFAPYTTTNKSFYCTCSTPQFILMRSRK